MKYCQEKEKELKKLVQEPVVLGILGAIFALVFFFILYPIYSVLVESLVIEGVLSLANYAKFITSSYFRHTLYNTVLVASLATLGALLLGLIFAYGLVRTDIKGKYFFMLTAILPLVTPPYLNAFAFILLLGRVGIINQILEALLGIKFVIYGWPGVVLAEVFSFFPLAFLVLSSNLSAIDPRLEEAAEDLGAPYWRVVRTVTLPLITPGIFSAAILVFMFTVSAFGAPALLGGGKLFYKEATMIAPEAIIQILGIFDWGMGATLAVILIIPSLLFFIFQNWYLKKRAYVTVTGTPSAFEDRPAPPVVKWIIFTICLAVSLAILVLYGVIFVGAFTETWGVNYSFTLDHLRTVWRAASQSIVNSIILSLGSAFIASLVGLVIAYMIVRKKFIGRDSLDFLAMLPYALPGVVTGLGFAVAFSKGFLILSGTWVIIFLNHVIRRMPFALRAGVASLKQIDESIEEASADLGGTWLRTFSKITIPLLKPTFVAGVTFSFLKTMTDITAVIFLVSPRWKLMSVDIYNYVLAGRLGTAAALSTIMVAITIIVLGVIWKLSGLGFKIFSVG